jgi:hypothetical protein
MEVIGEVPTWANGYGYGYGHGGGYGGGYGDGYGYGYGDGYGSCDGDGSGYGYGYGYGDGSGDGYGDGSYWQATILHFAAKWPADQQRRLTELKEQGATIAFWRSSADGRPCNGGYGEPVYPGLVQTTPGPLRLCEAGTLHATLNPDKWQGERWWVVALIDEVVHDSSKMGALTREILGEAL